MSRRLTLRSGWVRLALVLVVAWVGTWGTVYFLNNRTAATYQSVGDTYNAINRDLLRGGHEMDPTAEKEAQDAFAIRDRARDWESWALLIGLGGLIAVPVLAGAGWWVWRGFRPKA